MPAGTLVSAGSDLTPHRWFFFFAQTIIFCPHIAFAVLSLEPANRKMPLSHCLEMLNEDIIHGPPAKCAQDRNSLSGDLFP